MWGKGVVAEALVPDAANHLAGMVADLALQREAHVGSAGEAEFQQLGVVGGDLHGEVHVDPQLLDQVDQPLQGIGQGPLGDDGFPSFHIGFLAPSDDGKDEVPNLQLLCSCCNRAKATRGSHGFRMKMAELRARNAAEGMMVAEGLAALTGRRLAQYHREGNGRSV